ncbi:MAG: hypothetical protein M3Y87_10715 [Myxococcota bacterium]|nr:hypothetical protein [Myxococcota bacterium]
MTSLRTDILLALVVVLAPLGIAGCGGGQYGYAHTYEPLGDERAYMDRAVELSYEEVRRTRPELQQMVGWFGVVTEPPQMQEDGRARVVLSLRAHQDRHLCETSSADTCRVTVSAREVGPFVALIPIREEDRSGPRRLWTGSLLKVYGAATGEEEETSGPILVADWYRHWPPHYYVTTASSGSMRQ